MSQECAERLDDAGVMDFAVNSNDEDETTNPFSINVATLNEPVSREAEWKTAYDTIRHQNRQTMIEDIPSESGPSQHRPSFVLSRNSRANQRVEPYRRGHDGELGQGGFFPDGSHSGLGQRELDLVNQISVEYSLNEEQDIAFRIICSRAANAPGDSSALRMYLGGPGGTGKSRVIHAISAYFAMRGEARRLRLAAFTGVAASNIGGVTLHSALMLGQVDGKRVGVKHRRELLAMWEGVDFLIIDEVSMIGCDMMYRVHRALTIAKGKEAAFGGINIIFAGDFAQLPPIRQPKLITNVKRMAAYNSSTSKGQNYLLGKLLWLSVDKAIILTKQMRQSSEHSQRFRDLLGRLRLGACNDSDYDLLKTRVIGVHDGLADASSWAGAVVLVNHNSTKDTINKRASERYIASQNVEKEEYHSIDTQAGSQIQDPQLLDLLAQWDTGKTEYMTQVLLLAKGMPVILSTNYDVKHGAVNGTFGVVKSVRYVVNADGRRHATSCVITTRAYSGASLPYLAERDIPVLPETVDIKITHPRSGKKVVVRRKQLPLLPAFAMTVHKAQGLTLDKVIVDLESCRGSESAYVMVSRVRGIEDLAIMRPFSKSKVECRQSMDLRKELARLLKMHERTVSSVDSTVQSPTIPTWSHTKHISAMSAADAALILTTYEGGSGNCSEDDAE